MYTASMAYIYIEYHVLCSEAVRLRMSVSYTLLAWTLTLPVEFTDLFDEMVEAHWVRD